MISDFKERGGIVTTRRWLLPSIVCMISQRASICQLSRKTSPGSSS